MKNKKVYIRLIITYLLIFLIPLLLNILSLEDIAGFMEDNINQSVLANQTHARDTLDKNFQEIDTIVHNLSSNSNIRYIATQMDEQDKNIEISKIQSAQDYMGAMRIQTIVEEYYLFLPKSGMIISPDHIFLNQDSCAPFFQYDGMEWEDWIGKMQESYTRHFFREAVTRQNLKTGDMILYVQSLVTDSGMQGNFIFPIKSDSIKSLLKDTYVANAGWAYLTDSTGNVLLTIPSAGDEFELVPDEYLKNGKSVQVAEMNGRRVEIIRTVSENTGLTFVAVLPQEYISTQVTAAQHRTFLLMAIAVVVGIVSILLASWHRGRKIDHMLQMLFKVEEKVNLKGDEMLYISNSLKNLISSNSDLKDSIREKELITRGLLLENLLRGMDGRMNGSLEEFGIYLKGRNILVIAFQIHSEPLPAGGMYAGESALYKQVIQNGLEEVIPGTKYMCDMNIHEGALICAMDQSYSQNSAVLAEEMEQLVANFWEKYGIRVRFAVGNPCEEVSKISKIYDQVYEMLQYGPVSSKNVLFYQDYLNSREYYYFPTPLEERLVNAVKTGNMESMHAQLTEVYQINVIERSVSPAMMHFLVNDLQCAIFKAMHSLNEQIDMEEKEIYRQIEQLNRENDILLRFNRINRMFKDICEKVQETNDASSSRQMDRIKAYIEEYYCNSDMCLTKIADDFCYASTYFSKLFKELFGVNFTTYLEKVRINQVCLLLRGEDTMERIAGRTGYNSVYVMRSAFKRIKGLTPNDYRKLQNGIKETDDCE